MNHHTHLRYLAHVERYRVTKREREMRRHRLALLERRGNASDAPVHPATQFRHPRPAPEHSE